MRIKCSFRLPVGIVISGVLFAFSSFLYSQEAADPVEELRLALRTEDVPNPSDEQIDFRRKNLDEKIKALKSVSDLRRALALDDWKENPGQGRSEALRLIDEQKRQVVGKRLQNVIHMAATSGPPNARLAAANLIAEIGPTVRALEVRDRSGFARSLTPDVLILVKDADLAVRQEAIRALGTINPEPEKAAPVFKQALEKDGKSGRLLAAQGLGQMIRVANHLRKTGQTATRVDASEKDIFNIAQELLPLCGIGLQDEDYHVRIASLDSLQAITLAVTELIMEPYPRKNFPPDGRKLNEEEVKSLLATYESLAREAVEINNIFKLIKANSRFLLPAVEDADGSVRLSAINALESIGFARLKQRKREESVPLSKGLREKDKVSPINKEDPLGDFLGKGLPKAANLLYDHDVRIRRITLEFLESLEDAALPTLPAIIDTLKDQDRFVRWAAARTVGTLNPKKLSSENVKKVVPALGRLLLDNDLSVRQVAAASLDGMGVLAAPALPYMRKALLDGDVEGRVPVMGVLACLPPEEAREALPELITLLANNQSRLRKAGAETLGKLGVHALPAVPVLRRLLGDYDADVRSAASDAILNILMQAKE